MEQSLPKECVTVQTHDKKFHVDDVGAISLLNTYFNQKGIGVNLIRSRAKELLDTSDVLVDVGSIYDPSKNRFDHHQDGCNEVFDEGFNVPLSSIGMVWKQYGKELLTLYLQTKPEYKSYIDKDNETNDNDHITKLHKEIYIKCILELDGHDNGVPAIEGGKKNYSTYLSLGGIISSMNTFNTNDEEEQLKAFQKAVTFFGTVFEVKLDEIIHKYFDYVTNYNIVEKAIKDSPPNTEYLVITEKVPSVYKCLSSLDPECRIKFLIFHAPDEDCITVRTRNKKDDMYTPLVPLLNHDKTIEKLSDEEKSDLIFVHKNLFIAKTKTVELALKLVGYALSEKAKSISNLPVFLPNASMLNDSSNAESLKIDKKKMLLFGAGFAGGLGLLAGGYYLLDHN